MKGRICRRLVLAGLLFLASAAQAEHYTVPLLVPAGTSSEPQGVLRILNGTDESGTVEIYAIDDAGTRSGPATFTLNASAAVQFTATDLASGNATLGLTGGIGTDVGDARLEIETDLSIVPLAFVRAADGTLSAMHDTVRTAAVSADQYRYDVPVFNPASEVTQVSRLRLINPGDAAASVTIGGRDDSGAAATGGNVTLTIAAGGARTLTAQQLEAGDSSITGRLGAGTGKWRLTVTSDQPLQAVNIVAATAGYWNNLSTTAAPGAAPADLEALNERFVGNAVVYVTGSNRFTLNAQTGERFTETAEIDGVSTTYMGSYGYSAIGADAGRLTLTYDDGDVCAANLYFSTHTAGWFGSRCTGTESPAEGTWLGGSWSVEDGEDDGGEVTDSAYEVDDALPGVPTSGLFIPAVTSGGSVTATADGTTIELNNGGYFELSDGTRYTCTSADGCAVADGTVTRGTVAGRAAGSSEVDYFPTFRTAVSPGDQTYTVGTAIDTLPLPEASSGNAPLSYSLTPSVPGLTFNATARQLTGTPSTAGTYAMTYTVTDEDGDTDTLSFTIAVNNGTTETGSLGECYVSLSVSIGQSCTYPGTTDAFSVNERGRGSFLTFLAGIRIRIDNQTINGRVYDLLASHQGDGVWRIDRIAGSIEAPTTPPTAGGGGMEAALLELSGCTDGRYVDDPDGNPGLVGDCRALVGFVNALAQERELPDDDVLRQWGSGERVRIDRWGGIRVSGGRVTNLYLNEKEITDISALAGLTNLTELQLLINSIMDVSALAGLTNLTTLYLQFNEITDISALAGLTNLTSLDIRVNRIEDLSALAGLTNLTGLYLSSNEITDLSALAGLTNLTGLDLSSNAITDISALAGLTNLTGLDLSSNAIMDISELAGLTNLTGLDLSSNAITDISALAGLTNLTRLDLSSNAITDISLLALNEGWGDGVEIDVSGNPLSDDSFDIHIPALKARGATVNHDLRLVDEFPDSRLIHVYNDNVIVMQVDEDVGGPRILDYLAAYATDLYGWYKDEFDYLLFLSNTSGFEERSNFDYAGAYLSVMNDTDGTGVPRFLDNSYGSAGRLRGVIHFPFTTALRHGPSLHEVLHAWANFAVPTSHGGHWGFSSANGQLGGFDIANLVDRGGGRWTAGQFGLVANGGSSVPYSPIELYFAGLAPREDVPDLWVAEDGEPLLDENGAIVRGRQRRSGFHRKQRANMDHRRHHCRTRGTQPAYGRASASARGGDSVDGRRSSAQRRRSATA